MTSSHLVTPGCSLSRKMSFYARRNAVKVGEFTPASGNWDEVQQVTDKPGLCSCGYC